VDAGRLHVVAVEFAEDVVGDLSDEGRPAAEGGDAGGRIAGRPAGGLDRRAHVVVEPVGLGRVDQPHRAFGEALAHQEILLRAGDDVDNGIADAEDVVSEVGHSDRSGWRGNGRAAGL
jgi:hypothetical protein